MRKGGRGIQAESDAVLAREGTPNDYGHRSLPDGSVVVTSGGALRCTHVLHAVGPVWRGGAKARHNPTARVLEQTLQACFAKAHELGVASLSLPAISSGIFNFPIDLCASLSLECAARFFGAHPASPLARPALPRSWVVFKSPSQTRMGPSAC